MTRILQSIRSVGAAAKAWLPDALMISGAIAVSYGAGLIARPAGAIVAGIFMLAAGVVLSRGAE